MSIKNKKTILLVEDETITSMLTSQTLQKFGYNVITANCGKDAVETLLSNKDINLILMDIDLGEGIDGTEAASIILKDKNIPIVFLSSHTEPEVVEKTEKITNYGYVVKNTGVTVLDASIKMAFKLFESNLNLNETKKQFEAIIDSTADLIWSVNPYDFGLVAYNQGLYNYFLNNRNISIHPGMQPKDLFPTVDFIEQWEGFYKKAIENGFFKTEYRTYSNTSILDLTINVIKVDDKIIGLSVFGKDITERLKLEYGVRKSEEKFSKAFKACPESITIASIDDGRYIEVNDIFLQITGFQRDEVINHTSSELNVWVDLIDRQKYIDTLLKNGFLRNYETQYRLKSGEIRDFLVSSEIISIDKKRYSLNFIFDIAEKKRVETLLRENEEKYRLLYESAGIGIGYYKLDGTIISYNQLAAKHMGGSPEDFIGKSIYDVFPKEAAEFYLNRIKNAAFADEPVVYEDLVQLPIGNNYFLSTFAKINDSENNILGIQIISQDITELKQKEEKLATIAKHMKLAQRISKTGSFEYNIETGEVFWSDEMFRIFGLEPRRTALTYEEVRQRIHPDDRELHYEQTQTIIKTGNNTFKHRVVWDDGSIHFIYGNGEMEYDKDGKPLRMLGTAHEITEHKQLVEA